MTFFGNIKLKLKRNTVNQEMVKLVDKTKCQGACAKSLTKLYIEIIYIKAQ